METVKRLDNAATVSGKDIRSRFLIRAVNIVGDDPVVLEHLGDCLRDLGQIEEARRAYERAQAAGAPHDRIEERLNGLPEGESP